jgi:hypothetical protein
MISENDRQDVYYGNEANPTKVNPPKFTTYEDNTIGKEKAHFDFLSNSLDQSQFLTYLCATGQGNQFLACGENGAYLIDIDA